MEKLGICLIFLLDQEKGRKFINVRWLAREV